MIKIKRALQEPASIPWLFASLILAEVNFEQYRLD